MKLTRTTIGPTDSRVLRAACEPHSIAYLMYGFRGGKVTAPVLDFACGLPWS